MAPCQLRIAPGLTARDICCWHETDLLTGADTVRCSG
jgi:hypothetical protein